MMIVQMVTIVMVIAMTVLMYIKMITMMIMVADLVSNPKLFADDTFLFSVVENMTKSAKTQSRSFLIPP